MRTTHHPPQHKSPERGSASLQAIRRGALFIFTAATAIVFATAFVNALT